MLLITKLNIRQWGEGHQVGNNLLFARFAITISHASYIFYKLYKISYLFKVQFYIYYIYIIYTIYLYLFKLLLIPNDRVRVGVLYIIPGLLIVHNQCSSIFPSKLIALSTVNWFGFNFTGKSSSPLKSLVFPVLAAMSHIFMLYCTLFNYQLIHKPLSKNYIFRGTSTKALENWARASMIRKRKRLAEQKDRMLVSQSSISLWGKGKTLDKFNIVKAITGDSTKHKPGWGNDGRCMREFLAKLPEPSQVLDPKITPWLDFIPENAPIIDYLVVHVEENNDSWKLPSISLLKKLQDNRSLSYSIIDQCDVKEIVVGESSSEEVREWVDWVISKHDRDTVPLPTTGISLTTLLVDITLRDIHRMAGLIPISGDKKILSQDLERDNQDSHIRDEWKKLPAKVLVGNGVNWGAVISFNLGTAGKPWLKKIIVQPELLDFLVNIPTCIGVGIKEDLRIIEEVFGILSNSIFRMKFVDLEVLAHIAGWEMRGFSLTSAAVQTLGTIVNRCVHTGDGKWGQLWEHVPRSMKVYALGNLRSTYGIFVVLLGVILRDLFPDQDVLCKQLRLYQFEACRWMCDLLLGTCCYTEISVQHSKTARSREELIHSIRKRSQDGELSDVAPREVRFWSKLVGNWPAITKGGPRYLLQCRTHFLHQMDVIMDLGISWGKENDSMKIPDDDDRFYILFGISKDRLMRVDWNAPLPSCEFGLQKIMSIQNRALEFNPSKVSDYKKIVEMCSVRRLSQRGAVLEWARHNPEQIPSFINQMKSNLSFRGWFKSYYDCLRLMFRRVLFDHAPKVEEIEREFEGNFWKQDEVEVKKCELLSLELKERCARVDWLNDAKKHLGMFDRARLLHRMPQISSRKSSKRVRSRSRSRATPSRSRPTSRVVVNTPSKEVPATVSKVIEESCSAPIITSRQPSSISTEEREAFRKVVLVDFLENDDFSKYLELSGDTTLSDNEMESAVANKYPGGNNVLSQDTVTKGSEDVVPGLSSNSILPVSGRLPDIVCVKDGVKQICTYDDSLRKNISLDSSDEELFEINAPKNLLESL